jgi:hypothetical protein
LYTSRPKTLGSPPSVAIASTIIFFASSCFSSKRGRPSRRRVRTGKRKPASLEHSVRISKSMPVTRDSRSVSTIAIKEGSLWGKAEMPGKLRSQHVFTFSLGWLKGFFGNRGLLHLLCALMMVERGCGSELTRCSMFCRRPRRVISSDSMHSGRNMEQHLLNCSIDVVEDTPVVLW